MVRGERTQSTLTTRNLFFPPPSLQQTPKKKDEFFTVDFFLPTSKFLEALTGVKPHPSPAAVAQALHQPLVKF